MMKLNWILICLLISQNITGQMVETVATHPRIVDGLHVDASGNIYTTPGGLMGGTAIGRARPEGEFDPTFKTGFNGPIDIDANASGVLFVTNYDNNTLKRFDPITNEVATILTGLDGPAGLTLDSNGTIFLTCFGAPPAYNGNQIIRITPDGTSDIWLESNEFFRPQGIVFDDEGYLWVANTPTGKIFRIDTLTKEPELLFELGDKVGNLVFRKKDKKLYFASQGHHRIYSMDLQGNLDTLAGTGQVGGVDGEAMFARFNKPLGLGFTVSEDTLYVAEAGKLRRITGLDGSISTERNVLTNNLNVYPNPGNGSLRVEIPASIDRSDLQLMVANAEGQIILKQQVLPTDDTVELSGLKTGSWYIRLFSDKKMIVEKVIVF